MLFYCLIFVFEFKFNSRMSITFLAHSIRTVLYTGEGTAMEAGKADRTLTLPNGLTINELNALLETYLFAYAAAYA